MDFCTLKFVKLLINPLPKKLSLAHLSPTVDRDRRPWRRRKNRGAGDVIRGKPQANSAVAENEMLKQIIACGGKYQGHHWHHFKSGLDNKLLQGTACASESPPAEMVFVYSTSQGTKICHIAIPQPNISTCQDVGMWQIFVRWWWICCTTSCRIVVSSSVGGVVQHIRSRCPCRGVWHLLNKTATRLHDSRTAVPLLLPPT